MRILFDCSELIGWSGHHTGIQRVVAGLKKGLERIEKIEYIPFFIQNKKIISIYNDGSIIDVKKGDFVITAGSNWDRLDDLVALEKLKEKGAWYVNLFYDLTPIIIPHSFGKGLSELYKNWIDRTLSKCDIPFAISKNTAYDIIEYSSKHNIEIKDIEVIRISDTIENKKLPNNVDVQSSFGLSDFILCVGSVEFRKNHYTLLNAYRELVTTKRKVPTLVIVGHQGWMNLDIKYQIENDPVLMGNILLFESVDDFELDALYKNCLFTVYASTYEGWGLPIAESLNYGKPCIAANNTSLKEIAPELVIHAKTMDPYDWADKIHMLYSDVGLYNNIKENICQNYTATDWYDSAKEMVTKLTKYQ